MDNVITQLVAGQVGLASALVWLLVAFVVAMAGGALAGVRLAGKDLGNELAAMMGAMFGPTSVVPAVLVGLIVLALR
jgi:uncharacterized membrane protein